MSQLQRILIYVSLIKQDVDTYKANVRESIQTWFTQIKQVECSDWLIVLVETSDSKKSNKILPRTTVLDKVKNDFGGKTTERLS